MIDREAEACRQMWVGVAVEVLNEMRQTLAASKRAQDWAVIDGKRSRLTGHANELRRAEQYIYGPDFRLVCEFAGMNYNPAAALLWVQETRRAKWDGIAA